MCDWPDADARLGRFDDALAAAGLHAVATARAGRLVAVAECDPKAPTDALCAELATAIGRESAVGIGAPVAHCALLAQQDPDVLEHSCRQLLHPLAKRDAARGSELLPTLAAFLASGGRWVRTADELHIHVNTLRHRLARVEALTGRSLDDPDDRVDFHLALRATARAGGASG